MAPVILMFEPSYLTVPSSVRSCCQPRTALVLLVVAPPLSSVLPTLTTVSTPVISILRPRRIALALLEPLPTVLLLRLTSAPLLMMIFSAPTSTPTWLLLELVVESGVVRFTLAPSIFKVPKSLIWSLEVTLEPPKVKPPPVKSSSLMVMLWPWPSKTTVEPAVLPLEVWMW